MPFYLAHPDFFHAYLALSISAGALAPLFFPQWYTPKAPKRTAAQ